MEEETWIIEGVGYWEEMEQRLCESDLAIFLDVPVDVCKQRAEMRIAQERYEPNPDITPGCVYGPMKERQMEVIDYFHRELRPRIFDYLSILEPVKVKIIESRSELGL